MTDKCPSCTSEYRYKRFYTALLDENVVCVDPWHDAEAPAQHDSFIDRAWDRYWASLDKDSQDKLTAAGIDGARAWFGIGAVWSQNS